MARGKMLLQQCQRINHTNKDETHVGVNSKVTSNSSEFSSRCRRIAFANYSRYKVNTLSTTHRRAIEGADDGVHEEQGSLSVILPSVEPMAPAICA